MHKPIQLQEISLSFPHKTCFEDVNAHVPYGSRIAIIGRNGSGKSTLLKIILGTYPPSGGNIIISTDAKIGYVPQIIQDVQPLSGGQRFNESLTKALHKNPNILLLDEPTNHLDQSNRKSLMRLLNSFPGTLIIVSHDRELLRTCIDNFWHIENGCIHIFTGNFDDYQREIQLKSASLHKDLSLLNKHKKELHDKLMQEQQRAAKSRAKGEKNIKNRKWLKMVGNLKGMKAEKSQGQKLKKLDETKSHINTRLADLNPPEIIKPKFTIPTTNIPSTALIEISDGSVGYRHSNNSAQSNDIDVLSQINFSLYGTQRMAITGKNGSGKSTLIKGILNDDALYRKGYWHIVNQKDIGYLDQHYLNLHHPSHHIRNYDDNTTVLETIENLAPNFSHAEIRRHLNDFLFRKNEEINAPTSSLSGGERARLSLAQIALKTPKLLILDEITNNLDLETLEHTIQVLKDYPGAMIVVSHDESFLREIGIEDKFCLP